MTLESIKSVMGARAAYREAVRRWGKDAAIWMSRGRYHVGRFDWFGILLLARGSGKNWRAAFADADSRGRGSRIPATWDAKGEDDRDSVIARERLVQAQEDPVRVVSGDELKERLDDAHGEAEKVQR